MKAEAVSAIEEILKGLEEEGEKQKQKILKEAKSEARKIVSEAKKRAKEIYQSIYQENVSRIRAETQKIIRDAELQAERLVTDVKLRFLNEVFEQAIKEIVSQRQSERYKNAMKRFLEECISEAGAGKLVKIADEESLSEWLVKISSGKLSKKEALEAARKILEDKDESERFLELIYRKIEKESPAFVVKCNPLDLRIVQDCLKELKISCRTVEDPNIEGGLIVATADERMVFDCTLKARANKLKRLFAKELVEEFFSEI